MFHTGGTIAAIFVGLLFLFSRISTCFATTHIFFEDREFRHPRLVGYSNRAAHWLNAHTENIIDMGIVPVRDHRGPSPSTRDALDLFAPSGELLETFTLSNGGALEEIRRFSTRMGGRDNIQRHFLGFDHRGDRALRDNKYFVVGVLHRDLSEQQQLDALERMEEKAKGDPGWTYVYTRSAKGGDAAKLLAMIGHLRPSLEFARGRDLSVSYYRVIKGEGLPSVMKEGEDVI